MSQDDDGVGYRKPPKHSRFKPGASGNPRGRPRRFGHFEADLLEELNAEVPFCENGVARIISKQRAVINTMIAAAIKGNMSAAGALLAILVRSSSRAEPDPESTDETDDDQTLVKRFKRRQREATSSQSPAVKNLSAKGTRP